MSFQRTKEIKNYLEEIKYGGFWEKLKSAQEKEPFFQVKIEAIYKRIRKGISFWERLVVKMENRIGPYLLLFWNLTFSFLENQYYIARYHISRIDDFKKGESYKLVIIFTSPTPSTYRSQFKILKRLDELDIPTVAVTLKKTYKVKEKELKNLKRCKFLFLDQEIKRLSPKYYWQAKKKSREQAAVVLSSIKDEKTLKILTFYRDLIELNLQIQNLLEAVYQKLFSKIGLKVIVANGFQGGLLKSLEGQNIKAIAIQHGAVSKEKGPAPIGQEDELIVWGDFWKDVFQNRISSKTELISLGCARFDDIVSWKEKPRRKGFYDRFKLNSKKPTLVFFSESHGGAASPGFYKTIIRGVAGLKQEMGDKINLIIRLHPGGETPALYVETLDRSVLEKMVFLKSQVPLYEILRHCDIGVSVGSTVLLEVMAFGIPAIQFNPSEELRAIEFPKSGLVRDRRKLVDKVKLLISNSQHQKETLNQQHRFLENMLVNIGTATDKIVEYLLANSN